VTVPDALHRLLRPASPRTIRVQLTLAVTAVIAVVVALVGLALVVRADQRNRDAVDRSLATRAELVRTAAAGSGSLPTDGTYAVRLIDASGVRVERGATTRFSLPVDNGYSTVTAADGTHWRSWAESLPSGAQLQILIDLSAVESEHSGNVMTIDLLVLLAAVVAAAGTWFVGGIVLRPLRRLARDARALGADDLTVRLPAAGEPPEVAELGTAINGALDRMTERVGALQLDNSAIELAAAEAGERAAERFATRAGEQLRPPLAALGDELDQLLDNPDMPATQRHLLLAAVQAEHRRLVRLVDDLEAGARRASGG
jgi:HAMP domain-containing protein